MDHLDHNNRKPDRFELSGGALCLDFANTWGNHADVGSDLLTRYEHLIAFARQTGCLPDEVVTSMTRKSLEDGTGAEAALALGRECRDLVFRIFSNVAAGRDTAATDIERVNSLLADGLSFRRLERYDQSFKWQWITDAGDPLRSPLWPVLESAADLLVSDDLDRVRECDAEDCNWLFLDRSRNASRRWCSMSSCGNRAKARRRYRRERETQEG